MNRAVLLVLLGVAGAGFPTASQARTMQQKLEAACATDIQKLCPDAASDADKLKACMLTKRADVTPDCMKFFDASE